MSDITEYKEAIKELEDTVKDGYAIRISRTTCKQAIDCMRETQERHNPQPCCAYCKEESPDDKRIRCFYETGAAERIPTNYCPVCGRKLDAQEVVNQDNPLTLEQLKTWDGAVWLKTPHWQGWAFPVYSVFEGQLYFTCNGHDIILRAAEDYAAVTKWGYVTYAYQPKEE